MLLSLAVDSYAFVSARLSALGNEFFITELRIYPADPVGSWYPSGDYWVHATLEWFNGMSHR